MTQVGSNRYALAGDRYIVTATFTPLSNADTWDTGLRNVDGFFGMEVGTTNAGDDIAAASISGGTITWGITGTITSALVTAIGT